MKHRKLIIIVVILILAAGGYFFWRKHGEKQITYRDVTVKRGDIQTSILATGTVAPENRLEIKPPIAGRAEQVLVVEGQRVKKGQILAWMSSSERAALLDAAQSKGAEELERWKQMYQPTPVLAPINGTIIVRNVESGQTFASTDSVLTMSDRLTVKAQVDETDISQIKLKQGAMMTLDAYPGQSMKATVDQIAYDAKTVSNVTTYIVDVLPNEAPPFMRSGMTANVVFKVESKENVLIIPTETIKTRGDRTTVLVRDANGNAVEKDVEVGLNDGKRSEITSGLKEGDVVLFETVQLKEKSNATNPFSPMGGPKRPSTGGGRK